MKIQYTSALGLIVRPLAIADLRATFLHLSQSNEERAWKFVDASEATFQQLVEMPHLGSPRHYSNARLHGLRQWRITGFKSYLIFYRPFASDNGIEVWRVLHATRDAIPLLQEDTAPE